jgi:L-iditol 2-dehydrogenase
MKASFLHGVRDIQVREIADTAPAAGEVLLEVTAVGICGSDLHTYTLGNVGGIAALSPLSLGHEAAGRIIALGEGVDAEHYKIGQSVAIDPATHCRTCEFCQTGHPHLCTRLKFIGLYPHQGAMRQRITHAAHSCVPVPASFTPVETALLEPLGVAIHAGRLAKIALGEDVFVAGCGAIGLLLIRLARLAGARRIFATDMLAWRLAEAANYGADILINPAQEDVLAAVQRHTNKRGVDVAIEAAWVTGTAAQCVEVARMGGRVIIVGIPEGDDFTVRASAFRRKELTITYSRRMKHVYDAAIGLLQSGQVNLARLGGHQFGLGQTAAAFEAAANYDEGVLRAMVLPNA